MLPAARNRRSEHPVPQRLSAVLRRQAIDMEREGKRVLRRRGGRPAYALPRPAPIPRRRPAWCSSSSCRRRTCDEATRSFERLATRIRAQDLHADGVMLQIFERTLRARLVEVSLEIDEEQVTRLGAAQRKRLDPRQ